MKPAAPISPHSAMKAGSLFKNRFDDGGISGGTLERPALQALLTDVDQGLVDMIVVYKIDRLTRSLSDFAKLIDRLEAKGLFFCLSHTILQHLLPPWADLP
jgi:DNA invertase Pin-like site-specific DNA recombinase